MEFQGKVVVVTGATSGIGRATALAFAADGARVVAAGRRPDALGDLKALSEHIHTHQVDLTSEDATVALIDDVGKEFGGTDILVNAAGIISLGSIEKLTLAEYDEMMAINVRSVLHLMRLCLPSIIEKKGNIVNVSSVTGLRAFPGVLAYCVSKAAVDQLTRCAALELASEGVRVNAVNPGVVRTNLHLNSGMERESYEAFVEYSKDTHPIGRIGQPEEIADLILYLASDKAGWITGATYSIDGGRAETCAR